MLVSHCLALDSLKNQFHEFVTRHLSGVLHTAEWLSLVRTNFVQTR